MSDLFNATQTLVATAASGNPDYVALTQSVLVLCYFAFKSFRSVFPVVSDLLKVSCINKSKSE